MLGNKIHYTLIVVLISSKQIDLLLASFFLVFLRSGNDETNAVFCALLYFSIKNRNLYVEYIFLIQFKYSCHLVLFSCTGNTCCSLYTFKI